MKAIFAALMFVSFSSNAMVYNFAEISNIFKMVTGDIEKLAPMAPATKRTDAFRALVDVNNKDAGLLNGVMAKVKYAPTGHLLEGSVELGERVIIASTWKETIMTLHHKLFNPKDPRFWNTIDISIGKVIKANDKEALTKAYAEYSAILEKEAKDHKLPNSWVKMEVIPLTNGNEIVVATHSIHLVEVSENQVQRFVESLIFSDGKIRAM